MAQVDKMRERVDASAGSLVGNYNKNIDVTSTDAFVVALDIDSRGVRESVFVLFNTAAANDINYDIWGNADILSAITDITTTCNTNYDNGWVLLKASTTLTASAAPTIETLDNPYTRVVVRIKATAGGSQGTLRGWHRGEN